VKTVGILLAAGKSTRCDCLKQFTELGNKTAVQLCLEAMEESGIFSEIIIVIAEYQFTSFDRQHHTAVTGGETRIESIHKGALACPECDCVIFHDAARPYFPAWGYREIQQLFTTNCQPTAVFQSISDSMMKLGIPCKRSDYFRIQTPNVFPVRTLLDFTGYMINGECVADSVMGEYIACRKPFNRYDGDKIFNDKITTHGDLIHARSHFCREFF